MDASNNSIAPSDFVCNALGVYIYTLTLGALNIPISRPTYAISKIKILYTYNSIKTKNNEEIII